MKSPQVLRIATRPGNLSGFLWHDVLLAYREKRYVVTVGEERDHLAWDTDVRQEDGREVTRRGSVRGALALAALAAVRARPGYTGASPAELERRIEEFTHRPFEIGDGFVVKRHPKLYRWLIYWKGQVQDVGVSFHGAPGYEKLSDAIDKAKKMKADLASGFAGSASLHESGQNPRVSAPLKKRISALVGGRKKRKKS